MTNFRPSSPLVLASSSQIRENMLNDLGLAVTVINPSFDEEAAKKRLGAVAPGDLALALAKGKAESVNHIHPDWLVIGADQVCECDGEILEKPGDEERAVRQLLRLQGKTHRQHSAVALYRGETCLWSAVETATLTLRALGEEEIRAYIRLDQPMQCCGGYAYERHGKHLFSEVRGNDDVILGFPVQGLLNALYQMGYLRLTEQVAAA
jgi:septum formation protein